MSAAFWLALALYGAHRPDAPRFCRALVLGALFGLVGLPPWAATGGATLLLLPLGLGLVLRLPRVFGALPLPIAVARLGCLAAGCCGASLSLPLPALEVVLFTGLHLGLRRLVAGAVPGAFLFVFGAVRVAEAPWRGRDAEAVVALGVASGWLALGGWLLLERRRRPDRLRPPARRAAARSRRGSARSLRRRAPPPGRGQPG